jgi:hypothetical protein
MQKRVLKIAKAGDLTILYHNSSTRRKRILPNYDLDSWRRTHTPMIDAKWILETPLVSDIYVTCYHIDIIAVVGCN